MRGRLEQFVRFPAGRSIKHLQEQMKGLNEEMARRVQLELDLYKLNRTLRYKTIPFEYLEKVSVMCRSTDDDGFRKKLEAGKRRRLEDMDVADSQLMAAEMEMLRLGDKIEGLRVRVMKVEEQRRETTKLQQEQVQLLRETARLEEQRERDEYLRHEAVMDSRILKEDIVRTKQDLEDAR